MKAGDFARTYRRAAQAYHADNEITYTGLMDWLTTYATDEQWEIVFYAAHHDWPENHVTARQRMQCAEAALRKEIARNTGRRIAAAIRALKGKQAGEGD